jgi:hypothetical protein
MPRGKLYRILGFYGMLAFQSVPHDHYWSTVLRLVQNIRVNLLCRQRNTKRLN